MQQRIGIDVGGTNTDAVLLQGQEVVAWAKTPTTADVTGGIVAALQELLHKAATAPGAIRAVMIGTTHFTNAVVQRHDLSPVAAVRLALPATACVPPLIDWPDDLRDLVGHGRYMVHGGHEIDGRPIVPFQAQEMRQVAQEIRARGLTAVAISAVFSPVDSSLEHQAAAIVQQVIPEATIAAFRQALTLVGLQVPLFLTQNDGTLMSATYAEQYPVLTFASGPTNSMRGAAFLTGIPDAIVIDIGGTTADVGALVKGFPRPASVAVEVGGVRTNFRMPDVYSFGLGGGKTLTASDIGIAAGLASFGDPRRLHHLDPALVQASLAEIRRMIAEGIDRMKLSAAPVPLIAVGGGSFLVPDTLPGVSQVIRAPHYQVANAVGAAIAQISGEVDHTVTLEKLSRQAALSQAKTLAHDRAVAAGAQPDTVQVVDIEEIPLGCHAAYAMAPWCGADIKRTAVLHTLSQARNIGALVLAARRRQQDPIPALVAAQYGQILFQGKIVDVLRWVTGGFARGNVTLEGLDDFQGQQLCIEFQNENLIARQGDTVLCTVPDLICILERDTATPINTELLRYGFRVTVVGLPAPAQLVSEQALTVVGPGAFGYEVPYRPLGC